MLYILLTIIILLQAAIVFKLFRPEKKEEPPADNPFEESEKMRREADKYLDGIQNLMNFVPGGGDE